MRKNELMGEERRKEGNWIYIMEKGRRKDWRRWKDRKEYRRREKRRDKKEDGNWRRRWMIISGWNEVKVIKIRRRWKKKRRRRNEYSR